MRSILLASILLGSVLLTSAFANSYVEAKPSSSKTEKESDKSVVKKTKTKQSKDTKNIEKHNLETTSKTKSTKKQLTSGIDSSKISKKTVYTLKNENYGLTDDRIYGFLTISSAGKYDAQSGKVSIIVLDSSGKQLYFDRVWVYPTSFEKFTNTQTGKQNIGFKWMIPLTRLGDSLHDATLIVLKFETQSTSNTNSMSLETKIPLLSGSIPNGVFEVGSFWIKVKEVGYYDVNQYYGETKRYLRMNLEIENRQTSGADFNPVMMQVIDDNNIVYDSDSTSLYDLAGYVSGGGIKKGYVLFDSIPQNTKEITLFTKIVMYDDYPNNEYTGSLKIRFTTPADYLVH